MLRLVSSQRDILLLNRLDKAQAKRYLVGMAAASGRLGSKWSNHALSRNRSNMAALLQPRRPSDEWTQLRVCRNVLYAEP